MKDANPSADISALEGEIDWLVYGLYGLSEEEVRIVEGGIDVENQFEYEQQGYSFQI
jgi:hypothetical protein